MLPDASPKAVEKLLDFMYLGQADMINDDLDQLLDLAEELEIIGLIQTNSDNENQVMLRSAGITLHLSVSPLLDSKPHLKTCTTATAKVVSVKPPLL